MSVTIIIANGSPDPIYLQIAKQIRSSILSGQTKPLEELPSIRGLAQDLRVSAITTKRAYDELEREGFVVTSPGKGSYAAEPDRNLVREARLREIEELADRTVAAARSAGIDRAEVDEILDAAWKEP
jgi:GntR family transcriptional regulator